MQFDQNVAKEFHSRKILLAFNGAPPVADKYGWLPLPSEIKITTPITVEERVGIYGGPYRPSVGAPAGHGFCDIGSFSYSYSPLPPGMKVGRYCSISAGLRILDSHHPTGLLTTSAFTFRPTNLLWTDLLEEAGVRGNGGWHIYDNKRFPVIGNDVWIARDVTLAMGITIGDGAIIAANSVVTKDVAPYSLVGGNPAETKKTRFPNEIVHRLLVSRWWDKDPVAIARIMHMGVEKSVAHLEKHADEVPPFVPNSIILDTDGAKFPKPSTPASS